MTTIHPKTIIKRSDIWHTGDIRKKQWLYRQIDFASKWHENDYGQKTIPLQTKDISG